MSDNPPDASAGIRRLPEDAAEPEEADFPPLPDPLPSANPELFDVHSAESFARAIIAHAVRAARSAPGLGDIELSRPRLLVSKMEGSIGVTIQIGNQLHCVRAGV